MTLASGLTLSSDSPGSRLFMLGNEAIARGALEAGVRVVGAYPGTPSTEIAETLINLAAKFGLKAEWSVNEKVAFGVAMGASICGLRSLAVMKHVGVNVASDLIMTATYLGTTAGLVLAEAEDPGQWSSSDEQDNRYFAREAYLPILEPSSPQEAKDMTRDAFVLSETFKQPFMLRSVTRIGHARGDVTLGEIDRTRKAGKFVKDPARLVMLPATARKHRRAMVARLQRIEEAADLWPYNQLTEVAGARLGIITAGISYAYTLEALELLGLKDKVAILKVGSPFPLPRKLVARLLASVPTVLVVEELEPFLEDQVKAIAQESGARLKVHGKDCLSIVGELSTRKLAEALSDLSGQPLSLDFPSIDARAKGAEALLPSRPPSLCAACPHRASHYAINQACKQIKLETGVEPVRPGDIGCYCLGANDPLNAVDTSTCMGSGFDLANGIALAQGAPVIAHLGDSTFFHSGLAPMINAVFNRTRLTMVVMDNLTTAMTGSQANPGVGYNASGDQAPQIRAEDLARASGLKFVEVVDPFDLHKAIQTVIAAVRFDGPSLIVFRSPCAILDQRERRARGEKLEPYFVEQEKCINSAPPYCTAACPLQVDARGYVTLVRDGQYDAALKLILEKLPFPAILGRVCTHPCESRCKRAEVEEPLAIMALKRTAAELGKSDNRDLVVAQERPEKVAVVGAGPAGLMAAYDLRRQGYQVSLFEASSHTGGMLTSAIPEYRLPRAVSRREIERIISLGIQLNLNTRLGKDISLSQLRKDYLAVFLATGSPLVRRLEIENGSCQGVVAGLDFLQKANSGQKMEVGEKAVVIGGGNVAIDCARTCLRLGFKTVTLVYRRSRTEMPALSEEVAEAEREGVKFVFLASPRRAVCLGEALGGIECFKMRLGPFDSSGRREPQPIAGSDFILDADLLITAVGERPDLSGLADERTALAGNSDFVQADPLTLQTALPGVFAGGDLVSGPASVIEALAAGRKAARSIDRFIRGESLQAGRKGEDNRESPLKVDIRGLEKVARLNPASLPLPERAGQSLEVLQGFSPDEARREAARCLSCGCQICIQSLGCPAIVLEEGKVLIDRAQCPGCGICADVCPTQAIQKESANLPK